MDEPLRWYVAQVKPRAEETARVQLARRGLETFYPRLALPRWSARAGAVIPMFPGYLFVRMALARDVYGVSWTPGVRRLVGAGEQPGVLDDRVVEFLREGDCHFAILQGRHERVFAQHAQASGLRYAPLTRVEGFNFSTGRRVNIAVFRSTQN